MFFNRLTGDKGESFACNFLKKKGLIIVERNYRTKLGEIDIIALDAKVLVFVEVKTRSSRKFGDPREAVNFRKQNTIKNVAMCYLLKNNLVDKVPIRFDCLAILGCDERNFEAEHLINAF
ncbi:MAG: YraN family protein [Clostridia bacterium]|nr:YraN family protein [Clostridia bacterium]